MRVILLGIGFVWILLLQGCDRIGQVTDIADLPPIYPDYTEITIPCNIAPLNFYLQNNPSRMKVVLTGINGTFTVYGGEGVRFPEERWKKLLNSDSDHTITVQISAKIDGKWVRYAPFHWTVVTDKVDSYLSYRLIEPGYEVWNRIQLRERDVETFTERVLADNNLTEGACMNCHVYGSQNAGFSFFHIRGESGGTILNQNGKLRKLNTKGKGMYASTTYGNLHPSQNYGVFSTNRVIPEFHTLKGEKLEVYDSASDILVIDFNTDRIITSPLVSGDSTLETFPVFSANGSSIYYCVSPAVPLPDSIKQLKYSLCRIGFDAQTGSFEDHADTLISAEQSGKSICFPKTSPDGQYILYTVADYGTFPIWHRETNLQMMNLLTGEIDSLDIVAEDRSDTYHSWSSNSRWFVFASKRGDGLYGKPYFCYVGRDGKAHKPFVLPQRDPRFYDFTLKSFNIPELAKNRLPFDAMDIERIYREGKAEQLE